MRLTARKNPEAIQRYRHLKPGGAGAAGRCLAGFSGTDHLCTRERGHTGPHAAHGFLSRVLAVWEGGRPPPAKPVPTGSIRRRPQTRGPVGLRVRRPAGIFSSVRSFLAGAFSSPDEISFILLFIVFVWFAIDVFFRIL